MDPVDKSPYFRDGLNNFSWSNFIDFKNSSHSKVNEAQTIENEFKQNINHVEKTLNSKNKMKKSKATSTKVLDKTSKDSLNSDNLKESKKRKMDRFDGMSEEEVLKRGLPDHLAANLDILIIGINPGLVAAHVGHHYAGPGNHFWQCMYLSGLIPKPMTAIDDFRLLKHGIGFTNMVERTTRSSADLSRNELKEGAEALKKKLLLYKPKIAVFNGKVIYEVFSGKKDFFFGKQEEPINGTETIAFVMPSSSARCAQLPRATDKVPFFEGLKKLRDFICGKSTRLDTQDVVFPKLTLKMKQDPDNLESLPPKPSIPNGPECKGSSPRKASSPSKRRKPNEGTSNASALPMPSSESMQNVREPSYLKVSFAVKEEPYDSTQAEADSDKKESKCRALLSLKQESYESGQIMDYSVKKESISPPSESSSASTHAFIEGDQNPKGSQPADDIPLTKEGGTGMVSKVSPETESFTSQPSLKFPIKYEPLETGSTLGSEQQEPEDLSHSIPNQNSFINSSNNLYLQLEQMKEGSCNSFPSKNVDDSSATKQNEPQLPSEDNTACILSKFSLNEDTLETDNGAALSEQQSPPNLPLPPNDQSSNMCKSELSDVNSSNAKGKANSPKNEFTSNPAFSLSSNFTLDEQNKVMAQFAQISQNITDYCNNQQQIPEDLSCSLQSNLFGSSRPESSTPQQLGDNEGNPVAHAPGCASVMQEFHSPFFTTAGLGDVPKLLGVKEECPSALQPAPPSTHQTQPMDICHPEDLSFTPTHFGVVTNT